MTKFVIHTIGTVIISERYTVEAESEADAVNLVKAGKATHDWRILNFEEGNSFETITINTLGED